MLAVWLKSWVAGHGLPYLRLAALGISVVAFAWLLRRPASTQLGLLIAGTVFGIGLLMFETVLEVRGLVPEARSEYSYVWKRQRCAAAVAAGEPFDGRSALDFLDDIRRTRPDMSIVVQPMTIAHAWPERSETLLPLGTLPERTALYCNEDGTWRLRSPDEHGFMNPRGLYRVGAADLLLLGDSYVAGFCVEEDQTVGGVLRSLGHENVALAASGNGPLAELATLREYGGAVQAPHVYWFFHEGNDLENLELEMDTPLARYIEPTYRQNLLERSDEIDAMLTEFIVEIEAAARETERFDKRTEAAVGLTAKRDHRPTRWETFGSIVAFDSTRSLYSRAFGDDRPRVPPLDPELLEEVLRLAVDVAAAWNGRVTIVYLPSWYRYVDTKYPLPDRERIRGIAEAAGMRFIDFGDVLSQQQDPVRFFPFGIYGHDTPEGYAHLARFVADDRAGH